MKKTHKFAALVLAGFALIFFVTSSSNGDPSSWAYEWPKTDFKKASVPLTDILSGGVRKDQIPSIDKPKFAAQSEIKNIAKTEPVIGLVLNGEAKAYPLQILTWHEIVNDSIGGVPVSVTFCPLCNAAMVFDRRLDGKVLDFGTTGKLRNSDLVMYDRQTETWWQQFTGTAIVGELTGKRLKLIPARLESYENFQKRAPKGLVLIPNNVDMRDYGRNPYGGYDRRNAPYFKVAGLPKNIAPLARIVTVGERAWALKLLREKKEIKTADGLILKWTPGQNSALDSTAIMQGRDVGNVTVQKKVDGKLQDIPYGVDFAFAFTSFHPDKEIITE